MYQNYKLMRRNKLRMQYGFLISDLHYCSFIVCGLDESKVPFIIDRFQTQFGISLSLLRLLSGPLNFSFSWQLNPKIYTGTNFLVRFPLSFLNQKNLSFLVENLLPTLGVVSSFFFSGNLYSVYYLNLCSQYIRFLTIYSRFGIHFLGLYFFFRSFSVFFNFFYFIARIQLCLFFYANVESIKSRY